MEEKRLVGTGTLIVNGAEETSVRYEITSYVSNDVRGVDAWIEAGRSVIEYAFRAPGVQLRLNDDRVIDVQVGHHKVTSDSTVRAEFVINTPI